MSRVTIEMPESDKPDESPADQLARALGDLRVLPSGSVDSRVITLTGDRPYLVAALYMIYGKDYMRAHELVDEIGEAPA